MAKSLPSTLIIDGENFLPASGYQAVIEQNIGNHHVFTLRFPADATEGLGAALFDNSIGYIGKKITMGVEEDTMQFIGLINTIDIRKSDGGAGEIQISGQSPTIVMSQTYQCASFDEGTTLTQVIDDVMQEYDTSLLSYRTGAEAEIRLPYTVQYNESDYDFLFRLCRRYGIWMYYSGTELVFGEVGTQTVSGIYGEAIEDFSVSASLQKQQFKMSSQNWTSSESLESESSAFSGESSNPFLATVKGTSDSVYAKKGNYYLTQTHNEFGGQQGVDTLAKVEVLSAASQMVKASGTSELPGLHTGCLLEVEGLRFTDASQKDSFGSYIITQVKHRFDHAGHYENIFTGIAEGAEHPPYSDVFTIPSAHTQRAVVSNNQDPDGLGRVQVQFPWQMEKGTTTPWIHISTPYGGGEKGFYFIPEVDEEVLVGFEGNNVEKPFVLSAGYNNAAKSNFDPAENNIKAIRTRSGHTIELNDTDGEESINIYDKEGTIITFNTAEKSLYIQAPENIEIGAKNIKLVAEENIDIQAKGNITKAAEGDVSIQSKGAMDIQATGDTSVVSDGTVSVEATSDAKISGQNVNVEGKVQAGLKGKQTKVEGQMTEVNGAATKFKLI